MPILAAFLGALFASLTSFLAKWLTKKIAVIVAGVAVLVAMTAAFVVSIDALYDGIVMVMPSELSTSASWIVPSNAKGCVSAILAAWVLRWAYDWNTKIVQLKLL